MSIYIPPENSASDAPKITIGFDDNTSAQSSTKVVKGGGTDNPSLAPTAGQEKTQTNLTETVTGTKLDNKTTGTNAGEESVNNWINGNVGYVKQIPATSKAPFASNQSNNQSNTTFNLPVTAPLSESARIQQELVDDYNYNQFEKRVNESMHDPNIDYEVAIDRFLNANPILNKESAAELQKLLNSRDAKIQANPLLEQYRNSDATTRAGSALNDFNRANAIAEQGASMKKTVEDAYSQQREDYRDMLDYVDSDVALMKEMALRERDANIRKAEADALNQRRNLVAASPIADLALQERLSAMGLSAGANNSSGYGETSRLQSQLATNNQVAQNYNQLEQSKTDYNNAYLDAVAEAHRTGLAQKMDIQKLIADVGPEAALAIIDIEKYGDTQKANWTDIGLREQQLAHQKWKDRDSSDLGWAGHNEAAEQNDYNNALNTAELMGEAKGENAEILGVEEGTKTAAQKNAEAMINLEWADLNQRNNQWYTDYVLRVDEKTWSEAFDVFKLTGIVSGEKMSEILQLPEGTTTADMNQFNQTLAQQIKEFNHTVSQDAIATALTRWEASGALSEADAAVLNLPSGLVYYPFVVELQKANGSSGGRSGSSSSSGTGREPYQLKDDVTKSGDEYDLNDVLNLGMGPVNHNQSGPKAFLLEKFNKPWD